MLIIYLIFCIATAIASHIFLFTPVLESVEIIDGKENNLIEYRWLTNIVLFLFGLIFAPILFGIYLSTSATNTFIDVTTDAMLNNA